jgi:hypothetical protein
MKRSFNQIALTAVLLLTLGVSTTFAATKNGELDAAFHKDFKHAELLSTEARATYTKFTFKMNGAILFAFYNDNGELLAVTHNIRSTDLPIQLMMQVKRNYSNYWISDLFEIDANDSNTSYITLENANAKVILRSNGASWETYAKSAKS